MFYQQVQDNHMSSQSAQIRCDERMREEMRTGSIEEARSGKDGIPHCVVEQCTGLMLYYTVSP